MSGEVAFLREGASKASHVHMKDVSVSLAAAREGIKAQELTDCGAIFKEIKRPGVLSFECEGRARPMIARSLERIL